MNDPISSFSISVHPTHSDEDYPSARSKDNQIGFKLSDIQINLNKFKSPNSKVLLKKGLGRG